MTQIPSCASARRSLSGRWIHLLALLAIAAGLAFALPGQSEASAPEPAPLIELLQKLRTQDRLAHDSYLKENTAGTDRQTALRLKGAFFEHLLCSNQAYLIAISAMDRQIERRRAEQERRRQWARKIKRILLERQRQADKVFDARVGDVLIAHFRQRELPETGLPRPSTDIVWRLLDSYAAIPSRRRPSPENQLNKTALRLAACRSYFEKERELILATLSEIQRSLMTPRMAEFVPNKPR